MRTPEGVTFTLYPLNAATLAHYAEHPEKRREHDDGTPTAREIERQILRHSDPMMFMRYEPWRHGGSYTAVTYPGGAVGCIASARHTASKRFEIACDPRPERDTYRTRDEAAHAERELVLSIWIALRDGTATEETIAREETP